eukprot:CAMPEP_0185520576 /NCGR_PEP_ID=MMETSP1366-20130426/77797_1 /TAXON_ID=38817 /ORGANISM="Gephyrocapsa oceanica, Strain RCC1303" /LENGTH=67 /DNA_ID=CAMNT_0028131683 /DNA_START=20 /DNA_END=223 /DNA_ORIENTATION=-
MSHIHTVLPLSSSSSRESPSQRSLDSGAAKVAFRPVQHASAPQSKQHGQRQDTTPTSMGASTLGPSV